ncbi:MAG: MGH1-like glycoside hydrolase domain-containing protein [Bacteroidales bacterium]
MRNITIAFLLILLGSGLQGQQLNVALSTAGEPWKGNREYRAAWAFLEQQENIAAGFIDFKNLEKKRKLKNYDVVWIHIADTVISPDEPITFQALDNLKDYVKNGGGLLLTGEAVLLLNSMDIEPNKPSVVYKDAEDSGYGRMLGFHSLRSHPVFAGLNGGAYVLKPSRDLRVRNIGYYGEKVPENGKVVATDWDYIFLRENIKLVTEYQLGAGKIIAVGAYMYFSYPDKEHAGEDGIYNVNRLHLEKFTNNCLWYVGGRDFGVEAHYWNYGPPEVAAFNSAEISYFPMMRAQKSAQPWDIEIHPQQLTRRYATDNFWDVAGERLLIMGSEKGGIDEIWAHPFMAFRDYEVGIKFSYNDSIYWLNRERPMITVDPTHFKRQYEFSRAFLTEIITVSPDQPNAVIHYEYRGVYPAGLYIRFKSNQRMMWPYSAGVLGGMKFDFNQKLNAYILADPSGDFVSVIGFNKELQPLYFAGSPLLPSISSEQYPIGHYASINNADTIWSATPAQGILVSGMAHFKLEMNDNLDVVIAAGNEGSEKAIAAYQQGLSDPERIYRDALNYQSQLKEKLMRITTPDSVFNLACDWAVTGSDRFFVHTPGLGKSLTAGYATTASGWDGEHKISGRPGYAWYFGRDAEWSGMALLHYGDFEKVKSILEILQDFQDLNGKIFHELSTSGFVHFDASDATPLYVVLAGRYLKHSGDLDFISQSWPHIEAAMDFMYSTDTDFDGLIENTNVGHGWVEGGGLFGSHTSLYLASCWAAALDNAAYLANATGKTSLAADYIRNRDQVIKIINTKYWNEEEAFYYHGFRKDGSFITEKTIMPAIPILFGQIIDDRAKAVASEFSTNEFSSDWGVRIVGERSPMFNPNGYHTGSVWPLYTGWTALAEYRAGRPVQGYMHIMNNLLVYRHWAMGFVEEVLNGEVYKPSGVCRHQCWSETMALQPLIEGMLGLNPDAMGNSLTFAPALPAGWDHLTIDNIRTGNHSVNVEFSRRYDTYTYRFTKSSSEPLKIDFAPKLPDGTEIVSKKQDGKLQRPGSRPSADFNFTLHDEAVLSFEVKNGIEAIPVVPEPKPGYESEGFRILDAMLDKHVYTINLQARTGARETLSVYINDLLPVKTEGAELIKSAGNIYTFIVDFPEVDSKYANQTVRIFVE